MHLHYNAFQVATAEEVATNDVSASKVVKTLKKLTAKDTSKTQNMGSTMTCEQAAMIPGTGNAFISPNPPGVMADIKMPMAPMGVVHHAAPMASHYDDEYRTRGRVGYGDR